MPELSSAVLVFIKGVDDVCHRNTPTRSRVIGTWTAGTLTCCGATWATGVTWSLNPVASTALVVASGIVTAGAVLLVYDLAHASKGRHRS